MELTIFLEKGMPGAGTRSVPEFGPRAVGFGAATI